MLGQFGAWLLSGIHRTKTYRPPDARRSPQGAHGATRTPADENRSSRCIPARDLEVFAMSKGK
jgi:hypothetical protein